VPAPASAEADYVVPLVQVTESPPVASPLVPDSTLTLPKATPVVLTEQLAVTVALTERLEVVVAAEAGKAATATAAAAEVVSKRSMRVLEPDIRISPQT
jgi:hypothetical protein